MSSDPTQLFGSTSANLDASSTLVGDKYRLLEVIGEGGMGTVWRAEQREPVKRIVAIKLIKSGQDSKSVLARFEAERQALAIMDHPNVAKILDGGVAQSGAPYFVMELVKGLPITQFCDERRLTPQKRLELFIPVCQAIQHAHQKGIIHRDIKPSNIMVAVVDDKPIPKVIDFGVAKATGPALTEKTLFTGFGLIGTPQYMSPEQASLNHQDIDTRSDIYSLGVLLYELLTGSPPFSTHELAKAGFAEVLRVIREEDPPRPSTKLSTADRLPTLSANRGTEPAKLTGILRSELDWIVMKALEKDRSRRYDSAGGFAADIARYLSGEAVQAHPPSRAYKLRKLLRQNRGLVIGSATVAAALVVGVVGTSWGLIESRRQARIAQTKTKIAESALLGEKEQREAAEKANDQAFHALESFSSNLMEDLLGSRQELTDVERNVLRNAQQQWAIFAESKGTSSASRVIAAEGARNLAKIESRLGLHQEAEANDRKSLTIWETLSRENPNDIKTTKKLAASHQNLGVTLRTIGKRAEAGEQFREAIELFRTLSTLAPDVAKHQVDFADCCVSAANVAGDFGKWDESRRLYLDALDAQERLLADSPEDSLHRENVARSYWGLAGLCKRQSKTDEARGHFRKAIAEFEFLSVADPKNHYYRQMLANLCREYGVLLSDDKDDAAGAEQVALAVSTLAAIAKEFPSIPNYRSDLARAQRDYAQILGYLKKTIEAEEQFSQAIATSQQLISDHPTVQPYQSDQGITYRMLADFRVEQGQFDKGLEAYSDAIQLLTSTFVQSRHATLKNALCRSHEHRANTLDQLSRHDEALSDWDQVLKICDPDMLHVHRSQRADSLLRSGKVLQAILEIEELAKVDSKNPQHWFRFAKLFAIASEKFPERKDDYVARAIELLNRAIEYGFNDSTRFSEDKDLEPLRDQEDFKTLKTRINNPTKSKD